MSEQEATSKDLFEVIKSRIVEEVSASIPYWISNAFDDAGFGGLTVVEKNSQPYACIMRDEKAPNDGPVIWINVASSADSLGGELGEIASRLSPVDLGESAISLTMPFRKFFEMIAEEARNYNDGDSLDECILIMTEIRDRELARRNRNG